MATHAHSIDAPTCSTPRNTAATVAALVDNVSSAWTADGRATRLLASCAALPPIFVEHRARYGNATDRWTAYAGYRVEALEAIRMAIGERLLQAYHRDGERAYEPLRRWCEQPNASDAVAAVLNSRTEH